MINESDESQCDPVFATVSDEYSGRRFDWVSAQLFNQFSRGQLQKWIQDGQLTLNDEVVSAKVKVATGDQLMLKPVLSPLNEAKSQPIALDLVFEDDHILVLNKPKGLIVHPGSGVKDGTLMNGLLYHQPSLAALPRAGIVHRLDKDTTGLMVVAKTLESHHHLVAQLQARSVSRRYTAVVFGELISGGTINAPIGRHPVHRIKMAVVDKGKDAVTHYRIRQRLKGFTVLDIALESGRTHQIRVHMAHIGYPLIGDSTYLGRLKMPKGLSDMTRTAIAGFPRQALHARELSFVHPASGKKRHFEASMPEDLVQLIETIVRDGLNEDSA